MNEIIETISSAPKVLEETYSDLVSGALKEAGKIGVDAVKTIRLALFPLQYAAALQDRLARYIDQSIAQVPNDRRIAPMESLILPVSEKLKYQEEDNPITILYINLLSRGLDKERLGEAHPAFINIITQLAPDEALIINELGNEGYRLYFLSNTKKNKIIGNNELSLSQGFNVLNDQIKNLLLSKKINHDILGNPSLLLTFIEHLVSLGIITYNNEIFNDGELREVRLRFSSFTYYCIELSEFGKLFYKACIKK
ncbi:hypothetical protein BJL95_07885 [Methylomonas sp. LWB]|uniref:Abi-alpha family protein n=1 Tax=Methylomonas sp. LWB TaxID=1905845 RepID=UPI0008DAA453|nr:Abi-alpha family protein [Methylomonas sp. LWB]OHX37712.1 hypothetical protein BJL95_07885 [Methylomonas sp. LWB]